MYRLCPYCDEKKIVALKAKVVTLLCPHDDRERKIIVPRYSQWSSRGKGRIAHLAHKQGQMVVEATLEEWLGIRT